MVKEKVRNNYIGNINTSSYRVNDVSGIKEEVKIFIEAKYMEFPLRRPRLEGFPFD